MEWALPATAAAPALYELRLLLDKEQNTCHFPIEVRWSREDDIWLSPSYGRETVWIGIVTYR
jgi:L-gulonolactone oxidase